VLLITSTALLSGCGIEYRDTDDPGYVEHWFTYAIAVHDADRASHLVIPDLRPRVESWLVNHAQYDCPQVLGLNFEMGAGGYGGKEAGMAGYTSWFTCGRYRLTVHDLKILPIGNLWLITELGQICEEADGKKDCDPLMQ
jgi:hypothetical protein